MSDPMILFPTSGVRSLITCLSILQISDKKIIYSQIIFFKANRNFWVINQSLIDQICLLYFNFIGQLLNLPYIVVFDSLILRSFPGK